jgi:predicted nucleic acid-binding protein
MILDTNALSALLDGDAGMREILESAPDIHLPVIVLGEYRFGLIRSRARKPLEQLLDRLLKVATMLLVDDETARHYADIREELKEAGTPIPSNDIWIAALARQHELPVLSRDTHFDAVKKIRRFGW